MMRAHANELLAMIGATGYGSVASMQVDTGSQPKPAHYKGTHEMTVKTTPNADALIRLPEVRQRVGLARTTIYNMVNAGTFPQPIKLGKRAVAWSSRAVDAWIAAKLKQAGQ